MPQTFMKDPDAVLDYSWDWSSWLGDDAIQSAAVTAQDGLTVDSTQATSSAVTAWLSGGSDGASYAVVCHVVTAAGREDDRTLTVSVRER